MPFISGYRTRREGSVTVLGGRDTGEEGGASHYVEWFINNADEVTMFFFAVCVA